MNNQTEPTASQLSAAWATMGTTFAIGLDRAVKAEIEREREKEQRTKKPPTCTEAGGRHQLIGVGMTDTTCTHDDTFSDGTTRFCLNCGDSVGYLWRLTGEWVGAPVDSDFRWTDMGYEWRNTKASVYAPCGLPQVHPEHTWWTEPRGPQGLTAWRKCVGHGAAVALGGNL